MKSSSHMDENRFTLYDALSEIGEVTEKNTRTMANIVHIETKGIMAKGEGGCLRQPKPRICAFGQSKAMEWMKTDLAQFVGLVNTKNG